MTGSFSSGPQPASQRTEQGTRGDTLLRRFMDSLGWAASGSAAQAIAQIVALVVLARLLSPDDFGVVSAAALITQALLVYAEFGVGACLVQRAHLGPDHLRTGATLALMSAFGAAILLWFVAPWCARIFGISQLGPVLRVYCAVFLIKSFATVAEATLQRNLQFRYLAASDALSYVVGYTLLSCALAVAGFSYWSVVIAHLMQTTLRSGMLIAAVRERVKFGWTAAASREIWRFSFGHTLSRLGSLVANQGDSFVAGITLGAAPLGIYGRAQQLVVMPGNQLGAVFDRVLFPTLAIIQDDRSRFGRAYCRALLVVSLLALPLSALIVAAADEIVHVVLGAQWTAVVVPLQVLAAGLTCRLVHKISDPSARAAGAVYARAWRQACYACITVGGAIAASRWGLGAIAWAALVASMIDAALMVQLCSRIGQLGWREVLFSLLPGLRLALLIAAAVQLTLAICSRLPLTSALTLILSSSVALTAAVVAARWMPRLVLGERAAAVLLDLGRALPPSLARWFVPPVAGSAGASCSPP